MFAEVVPDGMQLAAWLGCLAFFIGILNGGNKLIRNWRGQPLPEQLEARVKALENHQVEAAHQREEMSDKLGEAIADISALKKVTDLQTQMIHRTDSNVQRLVDHLLGHGDGRPR